MDTLYLKFNRDFGADGNVVWSGSADDYTKLTIYAPLGDVPDPVWKAELYIDYNSDDFATPFLAGRVIQCVSGAAYELNENVVIDFYDE